MGLKKINRPIEISKFPKPWPKRPSTRRTPTSLKWGMSIALTCFVCVCILLFGFDHLSMWSPYVIAGLIPNWVIPKALKNGTIGFLDHLEPKAQGELF